MRSAVRDIVGEYAVTLEDGQHVYDRIAPVLQAGQPVELDFAGVTIFAAGFFNAAIGRLLKNIKVDDLRRLLTPLNLTPVGESVLQQVIKNATKYYSGPEEYREAHRRVIQAMGEEG
jgi:hypothetical protein